MLGYLNGISFLGYDFQSYPNSQKISLHILRYPFVSYHIPTYPKISSGANSQMAISHCSRDGAVVSRRDERQPPQDGGDGDDVDDGPWLGLIQLLRSALARLPPPGGGVPVGKNL